MKRFFATVLFLIALVSLCACSRANDEYNNNVVLTFISYDKNIKTTLPDEEALEVIRILDKKEYDLISAGVPSCGFDKNISLTVGNSTYAIACDTCNSILDCKRFRFFSVGEEDLAYIHSLFEKYGGYFPCI